jgi:hypothetical protein
VIPILCAAGNSNTSQFAWARISGNGRLSRKDSLIRAQAAIDELLGKPDRLFAILTASASLFAIDRDRPFPAARRAHADDLHVNASISHPEALAPTLAAVVPVSESNPLGEPLCRRGAPA